MHFTYQPKTIIIIAGIIVAEIKRENGNSRRHAMLCLLFILHFLTLIRILTQYRHSYLKMAVGKRKLLTSNGKIRRYLKDHRYL